MTDKVIVITTASSDVEAKKIARTLVEQKLAACVNIVPRIQSVYRWKEQVEETEEFLLLIKTPRLKEASVYSAIRELHSYELPERISIALENGAAEYLEWIEDSVS